MANLARRRSGIVVDGALETIVATQLTNVTESFAISDTLPVAVPIGPQAMLRIALAFTGLIGGTIANTATIIRFNRRRRLDAPTAVSSGVIYSVSGFIVQLVILIVFFVAFRPEFAYHSEGSGPRELGFGLGMDLVSTINDA
jgi:hypothetical protein